MRWARRRSEKKKCLIRIMERFAAVNFYGKTLTVITSRYKDGYHRHGVWSEVYRVHGRYPLRVYTYTYIFFYLFFFLPQSYHLKCINNDLITLMVLYVCISCSKKKKKI